MNQILVQNIETFATITTLDSMDAFDAWLESSEYGIVSLDSDADGEYSYVALVAPQEGADWVFDETTQELEPVEVVDPAAEVAAKLDIMMELDNHDEEIFAAITVQDTVREEATAKENVLAAGQAVLDEWMAEDESTVTPPPSKPRKPRNKSNTNKGAKMRNFEILAAFITNNPGVSRTTVFGDAGLQATLRTPAQVKAIAKGDKAEVKRWNRRLNFLIREMRRQSVDIQIERKGRVAHYTIGKPSGQLELPFDDAAEARNTAIIGDVTNEVSEAPVPTKQDAMRLVEEPNQSLDFDALLATLDDEAVAPVK